MEPSKRHSIISLLFILKCLSKTLVIIIIIIILIITVEPVNKDPVLRTFARKFSNIDFFLQILPLKDDELVMSEM